MQRNNIPKNNMSLPAAWRNNPAMYEYLLLRQRDLLDYNLAMNNALLEAVARTRQLKRQQEEARIGRLMPKLLTSQHHQRLLASAIYPPLAQPISIDINTGSSDPVQEGVASRQQQEKAPIPHMKSSESSGGGVTIADDDDDDKECPTRQNFPRILRRMLNAKGATEIITWLPDGRSFVILDKERFASEVLPVFFAKCKLSSFSRKLNRWGFKFERETGTYSHPSFLKHQPHLIAQMFTHEGKVRQMAKAKMNFPRILFNVLCNISSKNVVEWCSDGRSFMLLDPKEFERRILPGYFGRCKFSSFARKLNRWGYKFDRDSGAYSHPYFQRDDPGLCDKMCAQEGNKQQQQQQQEVIQKELEEEEEDSSSPEESPGTLSGT